MNHPQESSERSRVLVAFGTRPEAIKLAPVIHSLQASQSLQSVTYSSGQHTDLLAPFVELFGLQVDEQSEVMRPGQCLNALLSRVIASTAEVLARVKPAAVLVQGDTTTALGVAMAAFQTHCPVGHVEAGLRTATPDSPFPEEMNRRLISRLARWHFTATANQSRHLIHEGIAENQIHRTGNTVVDALHSILGTVPASPMIQKLLAETAGQDRIVLTAHRRENHDGLLPGYFRVLARHIRRHPRCCVIFPVHPNPAVRELAAEAFGGIPRVHLLEPLNYPDFLALLQNCWAIASDSGGVQEEAPSLGKPLFILRESTERPEVLGTGLATLCPTAEALERGLDTLQEHPQAHRVTANPFGDGRAAERIVAVLQRDLAPHRPIPSAARAL